MKDKFLKAVSIVSVALSIFLLFSVSELSENIDNLNINLSNQVANIRSEVGNISSEVEDYLEEKSSIISTWEWEYGESDYDKNTVKLNCKAIPKKYREGKTTAIIYCSGKQYPMQMKNGVFTAELDLSLFDEYRISRVSFVTGDTVETQSLDIDLYPHTEVLPNIDIQFSPEYSSRNLASAKKIHLSVDGRAYISINSKADKLNVLSAQLVEYIDGTETSREDIDLYSKNAADKSDLIAYVESLKNKGEDYYYIDPEVSIEKSYELDYGKILTYCVEVRDARGYLYETEIFRYTAKEDGSHIEDRIESIVSSFSDMKIYNSEGKLLYGEHK